MSTILITGATQGLGREAARRLAADGHDVWAAARDPERGREVAAAIGARTVQLDVTDDASVAAAVGQVQAAGGLDVLVNNAGRPSTFKEVDDLDADDVAAVHAVNVLGPVRVLHAFLPLLRAAPAGVVVNVSSAMGSFTATSDPERSESDHRLPDYCSSKAALNMLTAQWAALLPELRVNCVDPGHTLTALGGGQAPQSVEEGAEAIVRMASIGPDGPTGRFVDRHGSPGW